MNLADAPAVLTVDEVAALLRIGRNQAYEAVRRGEIPSLRLGRSIRVSRDAVARLLNPPDLEDLPADEPHRLRAI